MFLGDKEAGVLITDRKLADSPTQNFAFSKDGKLLYGIRDETERETLFSVDVASGALKPLAKSASFPRPPRLSL